MSEPIIAFIGAGNMAGALIHGLLNDGYPANRILACDPDPAKTAALTGQGISTCADNSVAVSQADVLLLSVKPQVLEQVAREIAPAVQERQPLIVSIAAGIREATLEHWLGGEIALVRTMPNTPAMLQAGATVLHANPRVSEQQRDRAESIMRAVGIARWVDDEKLIDAVTAISGSGPAYFFLVMEAIEQTARNLGLAEDTARLLTLQTALGAARMAIESDDDPATLRTRVTSPGGTTERAIDELLKGDLPGLFERALTAARDRSIELSEMLDKQD